MQMYTDGIQARKPEGNLSTKQTNTVIKEQPFLPPAPPESPRKVVEPSPEKRLAKKSIPGSWIALLFLGAVGLLIGIAIISTGLLSKIPATEIPPTNTPGLRLSPTAITLLMATLEPTLTPIIMLEPSETPIPILNPGIHDCMYPYAKQPFLSGALGVFNILYDARNTYYYRLMNDDGTFGDRFMIVNHNLANTPPVHNYYYVIENIQPLFCIEHSGMVWPPI
jgi:hypothetical protein